MLPAKMDSMASARADRQHLIELLRRFDAAIVLSRDADGGRHGRPMAVVAVEDNGDVLFVTDLGSAKVAEIRDDNDVVVTFQSGHRFAVVEGPAHVVVDQRLIETYWRESWRLWFPEGRQDWRLCLLRITPTYGEYWDRGGLESVRFVLDAAKALATRTVPQERPGTHGKVRM
jgi:general stress protein 26